MHALAKTYQLHHVSGQYNRCNADWCEQYNPSHSSFQASLHQLLLANITCMQLNCVLVGSCHSDCSNLAYSVVHRTLNGNTVSLYINLFYFLIVRNIYTIVSNKLNSTNRTTTTCLCPTGEKKTFDLFRPFHWAWLFLSCIILLALEKFGNKATHSRQLCVWIAFFITVYEYFHFRIDKNTFSRSLLQALHEASFTFVSEGWQH